MRGAPVFVCFIVICAIVGYFGITANRTKIPAREQLCRLFPGTTQEIAVASPKGSHFNLLIGLSSADVTSGSNVSGSVRINIRTNILAEFAFDTASSTPANWLATAGLAGFMVTQPMGSAPVRLDDHFRQASALTFKIECDKAPESGASLWLAYLVKPTERNQR